MVKDVKNTQTVDARNNPFPLHPEMSLEPWKPDVFLPVKVLQKRMAKAFFVMKMNSSVNSRHAFLKLSVGGNYTIH